MPTLLCHLDTAYQCLRISGGDAQSFLQGQLSADLTDLAQGEARWTAWCNARGQVRVLLHIWQDPDGAWRLLHQRDFSSAISKLGMFVLRAEVAIEARPCPLGLVDFGAVAPKPGGTKIDPWRCLVDPAGRSANATTSDWQRACALAGEAQLPAAMTETEIPQSLGLPSGTGFSLNKGCYPGQEIIARVHYRGRPPRRLHTRIGPAPAADCFFSTPLDGRSHLSQSLGS